MFSMPNPRETIKILLLTSMLKPLGFSHPTDNKLLDLNVIVILPDVMSKLILIKA